MAEIINDKKIFSLLEVSKSVQKTITDRYKSSFWVKAEMNKLNFYKHSGHCYPELVEKSGGKVIAQLKSILWRDDFININNNFIKILKEPLRDGIKILFEAKIDFDPIYGLSLQILDIDPSFTLGDLEKEKQDTIEQLQKEKLFDFNKSHNLPLLPKRIAIISVETSKGYADFVKVLNDNPWNYKFFHLLFPSLLQGEKAVTGIIKQLERIKKVIHHFDVVAIIRGGGGDVGLSCYNNYELSKAVATFPIPIITGIGHATNETVTEMVAFQNAITPTKIAEFLIQNFHNFSVPVGKAKDYITQKAQLIIREEKTKIQSEAKLFKSVTETIIVINRNQIEHAKRLMAEHAQFKLRTNASLVYNFKAQIHQSTNFRLNHHSLILQQLHGRLSAYSNLKLQQSTIEIRSAEINIKNLDPINILKRGYSITLYKGKPLKDISDISEGEVIETTVFNGKIVSIIKNTTNE
ncbi:MAG TPA: exodeoxyribonuclease VII large subunit [Chitinophagales bacterium]|nr:exodeoxyribonuclease VII large subunit [Chitinophagales bacterium]